MGDIDLARRAVKAAGWRWMPGMVIVLHNCAHRIDTATEFGVYTDIRAGNADIRATHHQYGGAGVPDLDDGATKGCLLALVRERWGIPGLGAHFDPLPGVWVFADPLMLPEGLRRIGSDTEAEALVAALEAGVYRG